MSRRPARLGIALLALALAGCDVDGFLYDPAPPPGEPSLALAFGPRLSAEPGVAAALTASNLLRVQLVLDAAVVMDTVVRFDAAPGATTEVLIPVDRGLAPARVVLDLELRDDRRALLRGSTTVELHPRQVTTAEVELVPVQVPSLAPTAHVSAGILHSCALRADGRAVCWGDNLFGHVGDGSVGMRVTPAPVAGGLRFQAVEASFVTSCGLGTDSRIYCWGENLRGALGSPGRNRSTVPIGIETDRTFRALTVGGLHACGLTADGQAYCWGYNDFGQLGDGGTTDRAAPVPAAGALRFQTLTAGYLHTCGLATNGQTYCWGHNAFGQLGNGSATSSAGPVPVAGGHAFAALDAGGLHTCGLRSDGLAYCWGHNALGQLGTGSPGEPEMVPVAVAGGTPFTSIAAGGGHSCGLGQDARLRCWGYNHSGPLGTGDFTSTAQPTIVQGAVQARAVTAGMHHTCALTLDNQAMCWGFNRFGQLGDRSTVTSPDPGFVYDEESPLFAPAPRIFAPDGPFLGLLPGPQDP
jgi:alpha-tubulin suppressor-like RCC1 family protein